METTNSIIKLCQKGMLLESNHQYDDAYDAYMKAWKESSNSYESCITAHFVARGKKNKKESLKWNLKALRLAYTTNNKDVKSFYPSLYLCVGLSYEENHQYERARQYIQKAAEIINVLSDDEYGRELRKSLNNAVIRLNMST